MHNFQLTQFDGHSADFQAEQTVFYTVDQNNFENKIQMKCDKIE